MSTDAAASQGLHSLVALYAGDNTRLLNLYGPAGTIHAITYDQVLALSPEATSSLLGGRAVFVGFAETLQTEQVEHFATAFSSGESADLSGVEIAATAFSNLLQDRSIRELPLRYWLLLTFLAGLLSYLVCAQWRNRVALAAMAVAISGYVWAALYLFADHAMWIPVVMPLLVAAPAGTLTAFSLKYWTVHKQRAQLRHAFAYFVPAEVVRTQCRADRRFAAVAGMCLRGDRCGKFHTACGIDDTRETHGIPERIFRDAVRAGGGPWWLCLGHRRRCNAGDLAAPFCGHAPARAACAVGDARRRPEIQ
jgi:adenylate cyclase